MHQDDIYVSIQSESDYETYTVFNLRIQNISNDTLNIDPEVMYVVRSFDGGKVDSIFIVNPFVKIEQAKKEITESEEALKTIRKTQNTENTIVSIYKVLPSVQIGKKFIKHRRYTTKEYHISGKNKSLNNKLNQAQKDKIHWETNALQASIISSMNYLDKNVYMVMNGCTKAVFHLHAGTNEFTFPIVYRKY